MVRDAPGHVPSPFRLGGRLRERPGQQLGPREHRVVAGRQFHYAVRPPRVLSLRLGRRRPVLGAHDVGRVLLPPRDCAGRLPESSEAFIYLAMTRLMVRRLARS